MKPLLILNLFIFLEFFVWCFLGGDFCGFSERGFFLLLVGFWRFLVAFKLTKKQNKANKQNPQKNPHNGN